jgi:hypothetical protein
MIPAVSMRAAARRARMPEASWRQAETGRRHATREVLARMALVVGTLPHELEDVNRPDAATALRTIMRNQIAAAADVPGPLLESAVADSHQGLDGLLAEIVQGLSDIDSSDQLTRRQKAELRDELISGIVRDIAERRDNVRAVLRITGSGDVC